MSAEQQGCSHHVALENFFSRGVQFFNRKSECSRTVSCAHERFQGHRKPKPKETGFLNRTTAGPPKSHFLDRPQNRAVHVALENFFSRARRSVCHP
jgi:hypothetical protein